MQFAQITVTIHTEHQVLSSKRCSYSLAQLNINSLRYMFLWFWCIFPNKSSLNSQKVRNRHILRFGFENDPKSSNYSYSYVFYLINTFSICSFWYVLRAAFLLQADASDELSLIAFSVGNWNPFRAKKQVQIHFKRAQLFKRSNFYGCIQLNKTEKCNFQIRDRKISMK